MQIRVFRQLCAALVLAGASLVAAAAPISLQFTKSPLPSFLSVLYGDILQRPFVLSPDLVVSQRAITLAVTVLPEKLPQFLSAFLAEQGITVTDRDGVAYLGLRQAQPVAAPPIPLPETQRPSVASVLDAPLPRPALRAPGTLAAPEAADSSSVGRAGFARESAADSEPPSFARYAPKNVPPDELCRVVTKVFGAASCVDAGGVVQLVHARFLPAVQTFAEAVDARPATVDLSMTFIEVTGSRRDGFGLSLVANVLGSSLGLQLGNVADSGVLSLKGTNFQAVLDVLRTDTRFRQVASPSGLVDSGKPFYIAIGDEVPTLAGQTRDQTGQVTNQVTYRPSGVILSVTPVVVSGDTDKPRVVASVDAQVSSFSVTKTGVNSSPTLSKRQVKTQASIGSGEVVVIGGLTGSSDSTQTAGLWGMRLANRDEGQASELVLLLSAKATTR